VIEVLSPGNRSYDRKTKLVAYEEAGVPELWYFDPEDRTAEILILGPEGATLWRRNSRAAMRSSRRPYPISR
jgi:Uma2 family endonuclease